MPALAKPARTLRIARRLDREYLPAVVVNEGKKTEAYCVFSFAGSVSWQNRANVARSYTVTCRGGVPVGCTCPAGRHGKACKHLAGTRKLIELGELDAPADGDDRPDGWLVSVE